MIRNTVCKVSLGVQHLHAQRLAAYCEALRHSPVHEDVELSEELRGWLGDWAPPALDQPAEVWLEPWNFQAVIPLHQLLRLTMDLYWLGGTDPGADELGALFARQVTDAFGAVGVSYQEYTRRFGLPRAGIPVPGLGRFSISGDGQDGEEEAIAQQVAAHLHKPVAALDKSLRDGNVDHTLRSAIACFDAAIFGASRECEVDAARGFCPLPLLAALARHGAGAGIHKLIFSVMAESFPTFRRLMERFPAGMDGYGVEGFAEAAILLPKKDDATVH